MDNETKAMIALAGIYEDRGFDVESEMVEFCMEGNGYSREVIDLALECWYLDHFPKY